ncbi:MAG: hypothetical protein HY066_17265 [Betaproteobacteria bacterium]|nr:hypothetical protein [Betaproteobacteria bacterium]
MLTTKLQIFRIAAVLTATLGLAACGGGGGAPGSGSGGVPPGGTPPPTTTSAVTLTMTTPAGAATNTLTSGTQANISATVKDAAGKPVAGAVVTFTADPAFVVFTPVSGTALTGANGVASVSINAASLTAAGATTLQAAAVWATGTATSGPMGIAVGSASVTLGTMSIGSSSISAYGSTSISVPVLVNGSPAAVPISVSFTSGCVTSGKATITSPVTSVNGVATTTYKDNTCSSAPSGETVTASVAGLSATSTGTVVAAAPVANNVQFVSATPTVIATNGTGAASLPQSALVKFRVVDATNNGVAGKLVNFSLTPVSTTSAVTLSSTSQTSDAAGEVTVSVTSGPVPTPVWVVAVLASNPAITSQSNALSITTGLPTQNFFSLSISTHNINGWSYDGTSTTLTVIASDRLGNPAPDGTVINFVSEGGQIQGGTSGLGTCLTVAGTCSVTLKSANYRPNGETTNLPPANLAGAVQAFDSSGNPIAINNNSVIGPNLFVQNGRVSVLAYALGEKSFVDANGNNVWDSGETFYDLGDPFLDSNENGRWDNGTAQPDLAEQFFNYQAVANPVACATQITTTTPYATAPLPGSYFDAPSKANTCSGLIAGANIKAYVHRSGIIIFSGTRPQISQNTFSMAGACKGTFAFWLMDENNNPMAQGSGLASANNSVMYTPTGSSTKTAATITFANPTVPDSTHAGGTLHQFTIDGGPTCMGGGAPGTGYPAGTFNLTVTAAPVNVVNSIQITIN